MKNFRLRVHSFFGKIFNLNSKKNLGTIAPDRNNDLLMRSGINLGSEEVCEKNYPNKQRSKRSYKVLSNQQRYYKNQNK